MLTYLTKPKMDNPDLRGTVILIGSGLTKSLVSNIIEPVLSVHPFSAYYVGMVGKVVSLAESISLNRGIKPADGRFDGFTYIKEFGGAKSFILFGCSKTSLVKFIKKEVKNAI